jgi:hypothetical protein
LGFAPSSGSATISANFAPIFRLAAWHNFDRDTCGDEQTLDTCALRLRQYMELSNFSAASHECWLADPMVFAYGPPNLRVYSLIARDYEWDLRPPLSMIRHRGSCGARWLSLNQKSSATYKQGCH